MLSVYHCYIHNVKMYIMSLQHISMSAVCLTLLHAHFEDVHNLKIIYDNTGVKAEKEVFI